MSKTVFLGQEVHYYMAYIAYFTAYFCKFAITLLPSFATLVSNYNYILANAELQALYDH